MQSKRIAPMLMALAVATPLAATADSGDKPKFSEVDTNGDGKVTISEATQAGVPKEEAKREDIDNNKQLSKTDWDFVDMNPDSQSGSGSS